MDFEQIRKYWEQRAGGDSSAQSTTQDYYLREIEFRVLKDLIGLHKPNRVFDAGCGDARTTARLAAEHENARFVGGDYSDAMVRNAQANIEKSGVSNLQVVKCDVSRTVPIGPWDMIYTTRCLINLPTWELQQAAIHNIAGALTSGGSYVMIENFIEGHQNFNSVRRNMGLPEIPVREHNLFFERGRLDGVISKYFTILDEVNISSTYYLVSRAVYSKICQEEGKPPDYFDLHHQYAAQLPFCGEFGPVRMICMKRKSEWTSAG